MVVDTIELIADGVALRLEFCDRTGKEKAKIKKE